MAKKGVKSTLKDDRRFVTLRLYEPERDKIRLLGTGPEKKKGFGDRDTVLRQLVPIVKKLAKSLGRKPKPKPIRISMPDKLQKALAAAKENTGYTQLEILMLAIDEFRKEYPLPDDGTDA